MGLQRGILFALACVLILCNKHTIEAKRKNESGSTKRAGLSLQEFGFQGDEALTCQMRSKCKPRSRELSFVEQNCFCDNLCSTYGDCCKDIHTVRKPGRRRIKLQKNTISCMTHPSISPKVPIYIVTKCPRNNDDDYLRQSCENPKYSHPVTGLDSRVLYRNIYCALCAQDSKVALWKIGVECTPSPLVNDTVDRKDVLQSILDSSTPEQIGCKVAYIKPNSSNVRPCKSDNMIARCDRKWKDRKTERKCKNHNAYVYTGARVFKNKFCGICNYMNISELSCEDKMRFGGSLGNNAERPVIAPFSMTLDVNTGSANVKEHKTANSGEMKETSTTVDLQSCHEHHVYDPFAKTCRRISCADNAKFVEGNCKRKKGQESSQLENPKNTHNKSVTRPTSRSKPKTPGYTHIDTGDKWTSPLNCPLMPLNTSEYKIFPNRSIYVYSRKRWYGQRDYKYKNNRVSICTHFPEDNQKVTGNGTQPTPSVIMFQFNKLQNMVSFVGLLLSMLGLVVLFVVYCVLPPLRNVAGRCLVCLAVSLFLAQLLFMVGTGRSGNSYVCISFAGGMHYFFLASFFWMNVLAFDIWRTFTENVIQAPNEERSCRFIFYSVYAWFVPAVIVGGAFALEYLDVDDVFQPHYGQGLCWITRRYALLFLFALPIALLLAFNFVLYIITIRNIYLISHASQANKYNSDRNRFIMYIKLSFIMGLTWIFGFLASLTDLHVLWYVFIGFNCLQGIFMCFAFVCTKKVFKLFRTRTRYNSKSKYSKSQKASLTRNTYMSNGVDQGDVLAQETSI